MWEPDPDDFFRSLPENVLRIICNFLDEKDLHRLLLCRKSFILETGTSDNLASICQSLSFWKSRYHSRYSESRAPVAAQNKLNENPLYFQALCVTHYLDTCTSKEPSHVYTDCFPPERARQLLPLQPLLSSVGLSINSMRRLYSSLSNGSSLSRLRRHLTWTSISDSRIYGACPTVLIVHFVCRETHSTCEATVGALINTPWPFSDMHLHPKVREILGNRAGSVEIFSLAAKQRRLPWIWRSKPSYENAGSHLKSAGIFEVDEQKGICIGGSYNAAALTVNSFLSECSSWPSQQFGNVTGLIPCFEWGEDCKVVTVEVWAPYWARYTSERHPDFVAKLFCSSSGDLNDEQHNSSQKGAIKGLNQGEFSLEHRAPKCLANAQFLERFGVSGTVGRFLELTQVDSSKYKNHLKFLPCCDSEPTAWETARRENISNRISTAKAVILPNIRRGRESASSPT